MKLKKFLKLENTEYISEMLKIIEKDCKPFLKEIKKSDGRLLFRGIRGAIKKDKNGLEKRRVRKNRKPSDIPLELHKYIDDELYAKFGWHPRSEGVFATSSFMNAVNFGVPHLFFPIGKFKYVWSTYGSMGNEDLLSTLEDLQIVDYERGKYIVSDALSKDEIEKEIDYLLKKYTDKNLQKAMKLEAEISFKCDHYYLADAEDGHYIEEMIWG